MYISVYYVPIADNSTMLIFRAWTNILHINECSKKLLFTVSPSYPLFVNVYSNLV